MRKSKKENKPCPQCMDAISAGFLLNICETSLADKLDCKRLTEQYTKKEIDVDQIAEKIKEAAENDASLLKDLKEIEYIRKTGKL